jgi:hypothetical protein
MLRDSNQWGGKPPAIGPNHLTPLLLSILCWSSTFYCRPSEDVSPYEILLCCEINFFTSLLPAKHIRVRSRLFVLSSFDGIGIIYIIYGTFVTRFYVRSLRLMLTCSIPFLSGLSRSSRFQR